MWKGGGRGEGDKVGDKGKKVVQGQILFEFNGFPLENGIQKDVKCHAFP